MAIAILQTRHRVIARNGAAAEMNKGMNPGQSGWNDQFIKSWLDEKREIKPHALEKRGWGAIPVGDVMQAMDAEWLGDAIRATSSSPLVALAFEFRGPVESFDDVLPERDSLLSFNADNSYRYALITSAAEEFLYFKHEANQYFLLCGDKKFLAAAHRCSRDTARRMFFDYWADRDFNSEPERKFLYRIWEQYDLMPRE